MICIIRTMNPVTLSFAQAVMKDAGIEIPFPQRVVEIKGGFPQATEC